MRSSPLRVEQRKFPRAQMLHQSDQRDLRGIGYAMKHRFAKEGAADGNSVKSASEFVVAPGFNRVRMSELVQAFEAFDDLVIDPGVFPFGARANHFAKPTVDLDFEELLSSDASQRVRDMEVFQRNDRARVG